MAIQRNDDPQIPVTTSKVAQSPLVKAPVFVPSAVANLDERVDTTRKLARDSPTATTDADDLELNGVYV